MIGTEQVKRKCETECTIFGQYAFTDHISQKRNKDSP